MTIAQLRDILQKIIDDHPTEDLYDQPVKVYVESDPFDIVNVVLKKEYMQEADVEVRIEAY